VRSVAWLFVVCTVTSAVAVFLPNIEVEVGGMHFGKRTTMTLYQINESRELVARWVAKYHRTGGHKIGKIAGVLAPHIKGHAGDALDDASSAMELLDEVSDSQVQQGGQVFRVLILAFLAITGLQAALIFGELMRGAFRKSRVVLALVLAVLTTPVAVGLLVMSRGLVWEANDEIGYDVVTATIGAYLIAIAAVIGLVCAIVLVARRGRDRGIDGGRAA
jgi:hypothetical protein